MIDACLKVDFAPEQTFVDISNWGVKEIGIITTGKELPFTGHFDFAGMMLKSNANGGGVFQNIGEDGIVENLQCQITNSRLAHTNNGIIRNVQSRNTYSVSLNNTGGILYLNNGNVFNCTVWAEVKSDVTVLNYNNFGGIACHNAGTIDSCIFYGANTNSKATHFGGISAFARATATEVGSVVTFTKGIIKDCRVYMPQNKSFLVDGYFGGIIAGSGTGVYIENCTASIKITGYAKINTYDNGLHVGGIAGFMYPPSVIKNSSASGSIFDETSTFTQTGGIVGTIYAQQTDATKKQVQISGCESAVSIKAGNIVGGIVGSASMLTTVPMSVSITDCNNRGALSGASNIGGIVGVFSRTGLPSTISNCINYADLTVSGSNTGGFVGDYDYCGGRIYKSINYGNILGVGTTKGGFIGSGSGDVDGVTIEECISYAEKIEAAAAISLAGYMNSIDKFVKCKVRKVGDIPVYLIGATALPAVVGKIEYLEADKIPAEKPKPEVVKTMIMGADNVIKYQLDFNTDLIPAGTKIYSYKISVDGGSYFTQLIHKEYVLCKIDTAEIASSISIGKGVGQYSRLTFSYIAPTTEGKCMVLIRLSNNREYYL